MFNSAWPWNEAPPFSPIKGNARRSRHCYTRAAPSPPSHPGAWGPWGIKGVPEVSWGRPSLLATGSGSGCRRWPSTRCVSCRHAKSPCHLSLAPRSASIAMSAQANVQDLLADPSSSPYRSSPIKLLLSDARLVFARVVPSFLNIFLPIPKRRGGIFTDVSAGGLFFQVILTLYSLLLFLPLLFLGVFVGGILPVLAAFASLAPFIFLQGSANVKIPIQESAVSEAFRSRHANESWLFINGICTSRSGLVLILRHLEALFQRPIEGVHNRTLGPLLDLMECILQRDVAYATEDVRVGYMECKQRLQRRDIDKVVLMCHSQGGIIASLIVDQLLNDVPHDLLRKLEVYTFASAANHFSNPRLARHQGKGAIHHIEHYANGRDPVAQIGALAFAGPTSIVGGTAEKSAADPPSTTSIGLRFNGRLFVRWHTSGHLMLSH